MKEKNKKEVECELRCKSTAGLRESIIDDLGKEDADLLDILKDKKQNELEDKSKPIN